MNEGKTIARNSGTSYKYILDSIGNLNSGMLRVHEMLVSIAHLFCGTEEHPDPKVSPDDSKIQQEGAIYIAVRGQNKLAFTIRNCVDALKNTVSFISAEAAELLETIDIRAPESAELGSQKASLHHTLDALTVINNALEITLGTLGTTVPPEVETKSGGPANPSNGGYLTIMTEILDTAITPIVNRIMQHTEVLAMNIVE